MKNFEISLLIIIVLILIIASTWALFGLINPKEEGNFSHSDENFQKALSSENADDICSPPQGYTEEKWQTHMSHHPDRYAKCLN